MHHSSLGSLASFPGVMGFTVLRPILVHLNALWSVAKLDERQEGKTSHLNRDSKAQKDDRESNAFFSSCNGVCLKKTTFISVNQLDEKIHPVNYLSPEISIGKLR